MDLEYLNQYQGLRLDKDPGMALEPVPAASRNRAARSTRNRPTASSAPKIVPNYLSDPIDKQSVVDQLKLIRTIWQQPALQPYLKAPGDPFGQSDEDMLAYAKLAGGTLYHCVGTVAMGDEALPARPAAARARGRGLRVIDASVMPKISSGNTNAPTIMIAEKGAEMVLAGREGGGGGDRKSSQLARGGPAGGRGLGERTFREHLRRDVVVHPRLVGSLEALGQPAVGDHHALLDPPAAVLPHEQVVLAALLVELQGGSRPRRSSPRST